jgi:16S rRNA (guanine966-N2)-methyltransferase
MRITGGELRGRNLKVPKSDEIRPTQDRVREAIFNIIRCELAGASFLDLFAGSGAVGIEALSQGAARATFVEQSRKHAAVLNENLASLITSHPSTLPPFQPPSVVVADVYRWIASYVGEPFDIVFADPPYALGEEKGYASVLKTLSERNVVKVDGLFIAEMTAVQKAEETPGWELLRDRAYGKTRICIWRRKV